MVPKGHFHGKIKTSFGCHFFLSKPNYALAVLKWSDYKTPTVLRALRLSVRTPDFHSGKRGSIPLGRTIKQRSIKLNQGSLSFKA